MWGTRGLGQDGHLRGGTGVGSEGAETRDQMVETSKPKNKQRHDNRKTEFVV